MLVAPGVEQQAAQPDRLGHTGKSFSTFSKGDRRTTPEAAGNSTRPSIKRTSYWTANVVSSETRAPMSLEPSKTSAGS